MENPLVEVSKVNFSYPARKKGEMPRKALDEVSFEVGKGELFGLLGPNGGGKTTLFRILSTLFAPASGFVKVGGYDTVGESVAVRRQLGVAFQSPSLDRKLTARENLRHQGHLYGMRGPALQARIEEVMERAGIRDRASEEVGKLSGGLARRVEVAKALLHRPSLLLLDEPATGLDPGARRDLWQHINRLRRDDGTTVLVSTHLMEEAAGCNRIALVDGGRIVALGSPEDLVSEIGGEVITVEADDPEALAPGISAMFRCTASILDGQLRIEHSEGHRFIPQLIEAFPGKVRTAKVGRPTLEDVFIHRTGHRLAESADFGFTNRGAAR